MNKRKWQSLIIAVAIPEVVGAIAGFISAPAMMEQSQTLLMPPLQPPAWVFPVVWTVLYLLMGIASWLVWQDGTDESKRALGLYAVQLFCNFLWPIAFFTLEWRLFAFFWLLALIVLVYLTMRAFGRIDRRAGWLLLPYLVWCCFAAYLNMGLYLLNN